MINLLNKMKIRILNCYSYENNEELKQFIFIVLLIHLLDVEMQI